MRGPDHNPLIGISPGDTYNHCQQVLSILDMTTECQTVSGEDEAMGLHLILSSVRGAINYELEHRPTKKPQRYPGQV